MPTFIELLLLWICRSRTSAMRHVAVCTESSAQNGSVQKLTQYSAEQEEFSYHWTAGTLDRLLGRPYASEPLGAAQSGGKRIHRKHGNERCAHSMQFLRFFMSDVSASLLSKKFQEEHHV